jgi:hypothetical protein
MFGSIIVLCLAASASAAADRTALPTEYQVKAAILFNIAKFLEWPEGAFSNPAAPLVIGILGEDPFGGALEAAKDRTVHGRKIQIRRFASFEDVTKCQILFVSRSEKGKLAPILRKFGDAALLLVGDMEEFAQLGGMINLALQNEIVTIEINVDALNHAGIKVNSRLLNTARIVHEKKRN